MKNALFLMSAVAIPTAGSLLIPLAGKFSAKIRNWLALILVFASFILSAALAPSALAGKIVTFAIPMPLGFNIAFAADALAVFMAMVSSFIAVVIVFYSFDYISHYPNQNEYYLMVTLFVGSMMGLVYSANLIPLYLFWELTAIASWRLIGFFRFKEHVLKADKAFMVTVFGSLLMLIGFITIFQRTGSFDLAVIKEHLKGALVPDIAAILIMAGILSKSATLPFHTWLPDAGVAPSTVTALLHAAVLVKIGVYVYARLFISTMTLSAIWVTIVPAIAASSAIISAGAALVETDLKRIIAYSTVSQIAFIFLGLSAGGKIGIAGALLYILMHGLAKGGLFLSAGIVEQNTGTKDITKMGGLINSMPVTAIAFLVCSFSIMGLPPFGGFFSKYLVFSGAVQNANIAITMIFLVGAIMTILYLLRVFNLVFLGYESLTGAREGTRAMVLSVVVLAFLSLVFGIFIRYPSDFVEIAVRQMMGS